MENKIKEVFLKYSKSVDTEYNVYNCLIEEDWQNITHEIVKLFAIPEVSNPLSCIGCKYNNTTNDELCITCGDTYKNKAT